MQELEPEDLLEFGDGETTIHQSALRRGKIFLQLRLPRLIATIGGSQPVTGRHSTIDRPDSVSRVSAPSTIMKKIMPATTISQLRTEAGDGLHGRRTMREADRPVIRH